MHCYIGFLEILEVLRVPFYVLFRLRGILEVLRVVVRCYLEFLEIMEVLVPGDSGGPEGCCALSPWVPGDSVSVISHTVYGKYGETALRIQK